MLTALACLALIAGTLINERTLPWLLGHEKPGMDVRGTLAIRSMQGGVLVIGAALLARRHLSHAWQRTDARVLVAIVPLCLLNTLFWTLGCVRDDIPLATVIAPIALVQKLVVDSLHVLVLGFVLARITRARAAWPVVAVVWGSAVMTEVFIYWFGRTRFDASYFSLVSTASVGAYFGLRPLLFTIGGLTLCAWSGVRLGRMSEPARWRSIGMLTLIALVLSWVNMPARYRDVTHPLRTEIAGADVDALVDRLTYLERDSLLHVVREAARPTPHAQEIDDLTPYEDVIERYRLGLGRPPTGPLVSAPFRRVVLLMSESLSGSFSGLYNPELPSTLTPFLDSTESQRNALGRHFTVAHPTLPGMTVTFQSHPNPAIVRGTLRPPSFVDVLAEGGWRTVFMRSASRHFGGANIVLRDLGFQEQFGRAHFERNPELARYVSGWGACDRIVLEEAAALLDARRDEPTFLAILTADTHSPGGRRDYADLEYPEPPAWTLEYGSLAPYLRAIFRADHDVKLFLADLEERGLFDDETLVIVTADHMCPVYVDLQRLPGVHRNPFGNIPFILFTPRTLPPFPRDRETSQLDVGPSLLHLLGLDVPPGMWGRSVFDGENEGGVFVGLTRGRLFIGPEDARRSFDIESPPSGDDARLSELFLGWTAAR